MPIMRFGRDENKPTLRERAGTAVAAVGTAGQLSTIVLAVTAVIAGLTLIIAALILERVS